MNFGRAAQLDPLGEFVANIADRGEEAPDRALLLGFAAHHADEYARVLQVGRHANLGDRDQPLDPRVFQLTGNHDSQFVANLFRNTFVPMARNRHCRFTGY